MAHTNSAAVIHLSKVKIDGGTQSRAALNEAVVADYAEHVDALPPITVFFDGAAYWLADGFHRYFANKKAGRTTLQAIVERGTRRDAILHSVGANATHGLRRTNDDKRRAVQTLIDDEEWSEWSDNAIAKACGVSVSFVGAVRRPEVAERQRANREANATRSVVGLQPAAGDDLPAGPAPQERAAAAPPSVGEKINNPSAAPAPSEAPEPEDRDDDGPSLEELVDELQAENARLSAELETASADDLVAEAVKWRRMAEHAQREQARHMDLTRKAEAREARTMRALVKCGKAVGETDPDKIPAAVTAFVRKAGAA